MSDNKNGDQPELVAESPADQAANQETPRRQLSSKCVQSESPKSEDFSVTIAFLKWALPTGPWVLVAIKPETEKGARKEPLEAATFHPGDEERVRTWLENLGQTHNLYWTVNPVNRDRVWISH